MSDRYCANCSRFVRSEHWAGPYCFCSPMCRDTSAKLREYEQRRLDIEQFKREFALGKSKPNCGVPNCRVCSGAMRERKGGGDANG